MRTQVVDAADPNAVMGNIGPLSSRNQQIKVTNLIKAGIAEGARLVSGGAELPAGVNKSGFFVQPTLFADVNNQMTIAQQEIFGYALGPGRAVGGGRARACVSVCVRARRRAARGGAGRDP